MYKDSGTVTPQRTVRKANNTKYSKKINMSLPHPLIPSILPSKTLPCHEMSLSNSIYQSFLVGRSRWSGSTVDQNCWLTVMLPLTSAVVIISIIRLAGDIDSVTELNWTCAVFHHDTTSWMFWVDIQSNGFSLTHINISNSSSRWTCNFCNAMFLSKSSLFSYSLRWTCLE